MKNGFSWTFLVCFTASIQAHAAIVTTEDFSPDPGNVTSRDSTMTVGYNGAGYYEGSFGSQVFPSPQTDAFRITLADFTGDYVTPGITQIAFQMFAANVSPSDLFIRLIDGANVFSYQFTSLAGITGGFTTFTADLAWSFGWSGVGETEFNNALASVDAIEIELSRSGQGAQSYQLDNLQTLAGGGGGGGGGPSAVPEPNTLSFIALIVAGGLAWRRRFMSRAPANA